MNISKASMGNTCGERCAFAFQFDLSTQCNAFNNTNDIGLSYNSTTISPIVFNNTKYNLFPPNEPIAILSPSYHDYDGGKANAEMIICTKSPDNGTMLYICIPLSTSVGASNTLLNEILENIVSAPLTQSNREININLTNYTLNSLVPKKPYFFYESLTNETNVVCNCVAYGLQDGYNISSAYATQLSSLISPFPPDVLFIPPNENRYLFYNPNGPTKLNNGVGDQIYIDCSPTGNSMETEDVTFNKGSGPQVNMDVVESLTSEGVIYILCFVAFVGIIYVLNLFFTNLAPPSAKK
jgi:hypothetical protein